MIDPQLEIGPIESVPIENGEVPSAPTSTVVAPEKVSGEEVPLVSTVDLDTLGGGESDGLGGDFDPLNTQEDYSSGVRPTRNKLVGAAGLYNIAMLDTQVTPDSVEQMLLDNSPKSDNSVAMLMARMQGDNKALEEMAGKAIIQDPHSTPAQKLDAIKLLRDDSTVDMNGVQRQVAAHAAAYEYASVDEDDDTEWHDVAQSRAEDIPERIEPYTEPTPDDAVWNELKALHDQASEGGSLLTLGGWYDMAETATPIGSLPTLNNSVRRIYDGLGITGQWGATWAGVGTALQDLRKRYRAASPAEKAQFAKVVVNALKHDTGLFQDSNDLVQLQILDNLFSKELSGTDEYAFENTGKSTAQLDKEIAEVHQLMLTTTKPRTPERAELKAQENFLRKARYDMAPGKVFDDAMNLLDLVGIGAVGRTTVRFGTKYLPAAWKRMFASSGDMAASRLADAVTNTEIADQMGLRQSDALNAALPNAGVVERGANAFAELIRRQKTALATLMRQSRPVNLTATERAAALTELEDEVATMAAKQRGKLHLNLSSVTEHDDGSGARIVATFGKTAGRGYSTLRGAVNAKRTMVEEVFGHEANDTIMHMNAKGELEEVGPNVPLNTKGEFFIQASDNRSYASVPGVWKGLQLGDDAVADLTLGVAASRWTRSINIFDNITQGWISTRARMSKGASSLGLGMIKPIADLPHHSKQLLAKIVKDNEGKILTDSELTLAGADDAVKRGYYTFRSMDDGMYDALDGLLRNEKMRKGLKELRTGGVRQSFVKPYERLPAQNAAGSSVFDSATGVHTKMTAEDIKKLYDSGGSIGRMEYPLHGANGETSRFVLLQGKDVRVLPIPQQGVLPRIKGHYPHISQGNYVVYGVKNGERVALKLAATESDAAAYVARRQAIMASRGAKGKTTNWDQIGYELDGSLQNPDSFAQKLDEVMVNHGGVLFGQRSGGTLGNLSPDFGSTQLDPIAALLKGFEVATQSVTKGELIATMKQRLYNFLKSPENRNLFVGSDTPAERIGVKNINASFSNVKARDTAMAYAKQIELMERTPDAWRSATRAVYQRMAHVAFDIGQHPFTAKLGLKGATRKMEQLALQRSKAGSNVINSFMSTMHGMYIAIPAIRQFVMNIAQTTMATALNPTKAAAAWRQFGVVSPAVYARIKYLHGGKAVFGDAELAAFAKQTAKAGGVTAEELIALTNAIVDSGLIDAVSHNTLIKEAISDAAQKAMLSKASTTTGAMASLGRGLNTAGNVIKAPVNFLSKIGFQAGENTNQIVSFLHLYNADKAAGKANLKSHAYLDTLVGRTAELTGNMVSEAAPEYTRSIFKPFFQWLQFSHKMTLLGLPKSLGGSSMFTGVEKARMVLTQFLLFGAEASAVTATAHHLIEKYVVDKLEAENPEDPSAFVQAWRSDLASQVMDGVIFDYAANKVMQSLFGEANDDFSEFAWSKTLAPGAGFDSLQERLIGLFTLDQDTMMGVQARTASQLGKYAKQVGQVAQAQWRGTDDVPFEDRAEQLLKQGGSILITPYGKYLANQWAKEHDMRLSAGGKIGEGFTNDIEATLATMSGIDTKDRQSFYEARRQLDEDFKANSGDRVKDIANVYWENLVANSTKFATEAPSDDLYDELLTNYTNDQGLLLSALGRRDKDAVNQIVAAKLQAVASGDGTTTELAFVKRISAKLEAGGFGKEGPQIATYLRHLPFIKDNPQYSILVQNAYEEIMQEPAPENITTNEVAQ